MRVLVLGANGFFGRNVVSALSGDHSVYRGVRSAVDDKDIVIDLTDRASIKKALKHVRPDAIVNCAGIVENNEKAQLNAVFTANLLKEVVDAQRTILRVVISGSAAEYGIVTPEDVPVKESTPLSGDNLYARSKIEETATAQKYRDEHNLPVVVARIFNPIGPNMGPRFLTSGLLRQINAVKQGETNKIEISRLDAQRDLFHIADAAHAVKLLIEKDPKRGIYNIGSGRATSNEELLNLMLAQSKLNVRPEIVETAANPEPLYAIQADITRIKTELGWAPAYDLEETVKEIINAAK